MIKVELSQQIFNDTLNALVKGREDPIIGNTKGVPPGSFTQITGNITQFSILPTPFRIETDSPGVPHTIRSSLVMENASGTVSASTVRVFETQFVPQNRVAVVNIGLRKGTNVIEVFNHNDSGFTFVFSSHVGTLLTAYAREIFNSTQNPLDEQKRALFNKFASRIPEILIPFQDLFADPKSLRTLISRFVTRAYMTKSASTVGVRDFMAALLGSTPIFVPTQTDDKIFAPNIEFLYRSQMEFAGFNAHVWIPNFAIAHWLSFIKLIDNSRHFYKILSIGENEVRVLANGVEEVHRFDFDDPTATSYSEFNTTETRVVIEVASNLHIRLNSAAYPFDMFIREDNPLGQKRLMFDSGILFDSGDLMDAPDIDPGSDGFVGLSLSGRMENFALNTNPILLALDSMFILPSTSSPLPERVYEGYFTQQVSTLSSSTNVPMDLDVEGSLTNQNDIEVIHELRPDADVLNFASLSGFSAAGPTSISLATNIALGGAASIKLPKTGVGSSVELVWSGSAIDFEVAGGEVSYLTIWLGRDTFGPLSSGVPGHPGRLRKFEVDMEDGSGNRITMSYDKEHLVFGPNVLILPHKYPNAQIGTINLANIVALRFRALPINPNDMWDNLYIGRLSTLVGEANFRPARAKIALNSVPGTSFQSLFGSQVIVKTVDQVTEVFTGDELRNDLQSSVYYPGLFRVEGSFDVLNDLNTAENLRTEISRQVPALLKASVVSAPTEVYVELLSKEMSGLGNQNALSFSNPNPGANLIQVTSFAGGGDGVGTTLNGSVVAIGQRFQNTLGTPTVHAIELFLNRNGFVEGELEVSILTDSLNLNGDPIPGNFLALAKPRFANSVTHTFPKWEIFNFDPVQLSASFYWIVLKGNALYRSDTAPSRRVLWSSQTTSGQPSAVHDGSAWTFSPTNRHFYKVMGEL